MTRPDYKDERLIAFTRTMMMEALILADYAWQVKLVSGHAIPTSCTKTVRQKMIRRAEAARGASSVVSCKDFLESSGALSALNEDVILTRR